MVPLTDPRPRAPGHQVLASDGAVVRLSSCADALACCNRKCAGASHSAPRSNVICADALQLPER
eukprot:15379242-Alexandrium_andersonii.AAC.1